MKHLRIVLIMVVLLAAVCLASCNSKQKNKPVDYVARGAIMQEMRKMKELLPMEIPGTGFIFHSIDIDEDEFVFVVSASEDIWEQQGLSQADANSDKNIARVLSNFDSLVIEKLVDAHLGFEYIYKNERNDSIFMKLTLSADKIADVYRRVKNGTLEPFTMAEIAEKELSKMKLPEQIDEGVWLTDAFIKNGDIYYEAMIEAELEASDFDSETLAEMKAGIIEDLQEEKLFMINKKLIIKDDTHLIYIYKDNRGKEFARIKIAPYDIFDEL